LRSKLLVASMIAWASRSYAQEAPAPEPTPEPVPVVEPAPPPAPAPVVVTPPPVRRAPPAVKPPEPDQPYTVDRAFFIALEIGQGSFADTKNIYNTGGGRGIVLGRGPLELHFEQYDLVDQSKTYVNVAHADGIASITSLGYRFDLFGTKHASLTAVVGPALVSRPSMITDSVGVEYPILGVVDTARSPQSQWGIGAVAGLGAQLFGVLYADVRIYPVVWGDELGTRLEYDNGATTMVMMTHDNAPGGLPVTFDVGASYSFF